MIHILNDETNPISIMDNNQSVLNATNTNLSLKEQLKNQTNQFRSKGYNFEYNP